MSDGPFTRSWGWPPGMAAPADPGYKVVTVAELWPEHADHTVIYSEHGRTDYVVNSLELDLSDLSGCVSVASCDYDEIPAGGDLQMTEYWCKTCGLPLVEFWDDVDTFSNQETTNPPTQ